jgi:hypothetical protein
MMASIGRRCFANTPSSRLRVLRPHRGHLDCVSTRQVAITPRYLSAPLQAH